MPDRYDAPRATRAVREEARRQADQLAGSGLALFAGGIAVLLMLAIIVLDYVFNQDPHRILKVFMGLSAFGGILAIPQFGLLVFPVMAPFLIWIPPLPIPGMNAINIVLFAVFGMYALQRVGRRQPVFRRGELLPAIGVFYLIMALSIVRGAAFPTGYSYDGPDAALAAFRAIIGAAPYVIGLAMVRDESGRRRVAWAIVIGLVAESVITVSLGRNGSGMRATGSLGQSNELGTFLATYAVLALALALGTRNLFGKLFLIAAVVGGSFGVMLSLSRGAMLSLVAGFLYIGLRGSKALAVVVLAVLLTGPLWAPDYVVDRILESRQVEEGVDQATLDMSAEARVQTWRTIIEIVSTHPIDGVGWVGLSYILPQVGDALGLEEVKDTAHNTFLRILGELGVFGLLAFAWMLFVCFKIGEDLFRARPSPFDRALGLGVSAAVLAMVVSCAFGDRFFNPILSGSLWLAVGIAESGVQQAREGRA